MNSYCGTHNPAGYSCDRPHLASKVVPVIGGSGTSDYRDLDNKPSINGVTLEGDKTNEELLIKAIPNEEIEALLNAQVFKK